MQYCFEIGDFLCTLCLKSLSNNNSHHLHCPACKESIECASLEHPVDEIASSLTDPVSNLMPSE